LERKSLALRQRGQMLTMDQREGAENDESSVNQFRPGRIYMPVCPLPIKLD